MERAQAAEERAANQARMDESIRLNLFAMYHVDPKSGIKFPRALAGFNVNPDTHGLGMKRSRPEAQVEDFVEEDTDEETKDEVLSEA